MKYKHYYQFLILCAGLSLNAHAAAITVDCNSAPPGALSAAVGSAVPGTTIEVTGTCNESVTISGNDISLVGNSLGSTAVISGFFPQNRLVIEGAKGISITGFVIKSVGNASFSLTDVNVSNNILGVEFSNGSAVSVFGEVNITNNQVFGLQVLVGSKLVVEQNATLNYL